jgi:hypothetical protein
LDKVDKSRWAIFSTFDLASGFWQQSLQEKSRQYTAFSVPGKGARYHWKVTLMGLQGTPALFARLMDFVMTGVKGIITYIDDIIVHSRDHEQHLKSIEEVLWRVRKYGLELYVDKTIIGVRTVQYLGYTLSGQGVTLSKDKLAAIKDFPMPTLPKAVREFLGLANYFRSLIPRFSQTADPLNKMTRASTVWRTGAPPPPEAQVAFNKLKEALMSAPIVVNPNREGRFILQTDALMGTELASGGMGPVLLQEQKDKTERVVAYASRGLKDHETNYPAFLLEKAAACWGIDYFDTYLRSGSERKKFSFSFLLILDEGELREGWVKSAYSSLAATGRITAKQRRGKSAAQPRRIGGRRAPPAGITTKQRRGKSAAQPRRIGGKTAAVEPPCCRVITVLCV